MANEQVGLFEWQETKCAVFLFPVDVIHYYTSNLIQLSGLCGLKSRTSLFLFGKSEKLLPTSLVVTASQGRPCAPAHGRSLHLRSQPCCVCVSLCRSVWPWTHRALPAGIKFYLFYLLCMNVLCVCIYFFLCPTFMSSAQDIQKRIWVRDYRWLWTAFWCWELEEQPVLLSLSLSSAPFCHF